MNTTYHLSVDLGASSGRTILGEFDGKKIELEEIYRFANSPVKLNGVLYWDFHKLFKEIVYSFKVVNSRNIDVTSIAIDTWGVDFGYIDHQGHLILMPKNYRNESKLKYENEMYEKLSKFDFYQETGVYPSSINSVLQLYADLREFPWLKDVVDKVLFMPDLFNFFLTGKASTNYSIASTSSLLSANKTWSNKIFDALDLPKSWFSQDLNYGEILGDLSQEIEKDTGLVNVKVISGASHDTAASVLTVNKSDLFLSCGTWSVLGAQIDEPIVHDKAFKSTISNEGTTFGDIKLLKNINGLWILQELQRLWAEEGTMYSYEHLIAKARASTINSVIDLDDEIFFKHGNMRELIKDYLKMTNQPLPVNEGDYVRIALVSLSKKYNEAIIELESLTGKTFDKVRMVGGGIQNELLCELTASASGKQIVTGPIEASSLGNVLSQLIILKLIDFNEVEDIVKKSTELKVY
ncbi:rhamnulokinase [Staphylococcus chromogenes]|uniref:rhamnulokinase n=1 Tax=Staphylococcus chromogenes TaxID=46126 RepID=UPI002887E8E1|nr:rhamnulokinase family protein [Staphylococcus chromogenes]MDT0655985.1 rhamnulokinase family protein [Staphylococcus chromogenes]MDT0680762.1 rhamnulokinase family protein [Staphylococcus chromogenes]MDY3277390.1 rhamnulokinase family protein [Staphylococcus chromogenes]